MIYSLFPVLIIIYIWRNVVQISNLSSLLCQVCNKCNHFCSLPASCLKHVQRNCHREEMIGKVINYTNQQQVSFTSVTTNMRPQILLSLVQTFGLVNINQPLPWFSRIGQEKILSCFLECLEEHASI